MLRTYPPELDEFVRQELASGEYRSEDDLLVDALKVFRELKLRHHDLRAHVERSIQQAERGESTPLDMGAIKERLGTELDKKRRRSEP